MEDWEVESTAVISPEVVTIRKCTILIRGFRSDMSDQVREQIVQPLCSRGGIVKFISPLEAIAVFASPTVATAALSLQPTSNPVRFYLLSAISGSEVDGYDRGGCSFE